MRSTCILPVVLSSGAFAAVLDLPVWIRNTYPIVEVEVGTPPVSHMLLFDTGSSTTWMDDVTCLNTTACPNASGYERVGYDADASSTSAELNTSASMDFLGGVTAGRGMRDVFTLPGSSVSWDQTFLSANRSTWSTMAGDGFMGLAFSTIADAETTTVVETLMQAGELDAPRFGLYLGTNQNDTGDAAGDGLLTLGGSREDTYAASSLNWTALQTPGAGSQLWRTNMHYTVGTLANGTRNSVGAGGSWAVFDTGAGRISVPDPLVESIYASIGMNWTAILNHDVIPLCEDFTDDWFLDLFIGDVYYPTQLRITGSQLKLPGFATGEDKYCWPPFDTSGSNGLFLMGGAFLQNYYTVFNFGSFEPASYNASIGFAALKDEYKVLVA